MTSRKVSNLAPPYSITQLTLGDCKHIQLAQEMETMVKMMRRWFCDKSVLVDLLSKSSLEQITPYVQEVMSVRKTVQDSKILKYQQLSCDIDELTSELERV